MKASSRKAQKVSLQRGEDMLRTGLKNLGGYEGSEWLCYGWGYGTYHFQFVPPKCTDLKTYRELPSETLFPESSIQTLRDGLAVLGADQPGSAIKLVAPPPILEKVAESRQFLEVIKEFKILPSAYTCTCQPKFAEEWVAPISFSSAAKLLNASGILETDRAKDVLGWCKTLDLTDLVLQKTGFSAEALCFYMRCYGLGDLANNPILLGYFNKYSTSWCGTGGCEQRPASHFHYHELAPFCQKFLEPALKLSDPTIESIIPLVVQELQALEGLR